MIRRLFSTILLLLVAAAGSAQETTYDATAAVEQAVAKLQAGDDAEAMRLLEPLRDQPDAPPQALALLGALYAELGRPADALETLRPFADGDAPDPAVLYNAGRAARAVGELQLAERYLEASLALEPRTPAARELGLIRGAQRRYPEAYVLLAPWVKINPDDTEARMAAALCAVQLKRVLEAEEMLSDLPQTLPRVRLLWGRLLLLKGDPSGALAMLEVGMEDAPPQMQLDLRRSAAEAHAAMGNASQAVELLAEYAAGDPSVALQLAQAQYQSGELDAALKTLQPFGEALLARQPTAEDPPIAAKMVLEYGRYLAVGGRHEEALPYLERATETSPDNKKAWQTLGQTLAGLGRREEALVALERFQELTKREVSASQRDVRAATELDDPTLRTLREATALLEEERYLKALELLRQERAIAPADVRPILLEGFTLLRMGSSAEGLTVAEQAVQIAPGNADAVYLRGMAQMALQQLDAAEADYRTAISLSPQHTAAMNDLAVLLIEKGEADEARTLLEQALALNPEDETTASNLATLDQ